MIDLTVNLGHALTFLALGLNFAYNAQKARTDALKAAQVAGAEQEHLKNLQQTNEREFKDLNRKLDAQDIAFRDKTAELNKKLDAQDAAFKEKTKADVLSDGIMMLLQHRVTALEHELIRARANIHRLANYAQIQIAQLDDIENGPHNQDKT